jgi:hypothetical protein
MIKGFTHHFLKLFEAVRYSGLGHTQRFCRRVQISVARRLRPDQQERGIHSTLLHVLHPSGNQHKKLFLVITEVRK